MKRLLVLGCHYRHRYPQEIPKTIVNRLMKLYYQILERGLDFYTCLPPLARKTNHLIWIEKVGMKPKQEFA